ncbi:ATP-grasp domain-containing protein [Pseudomonas huanghezhanensis]|uniref:ATP-grasp domain-containing protein n=1 Tax=Pseudomonas huanghezhanensis TaxID=3002903 RepID=UPI0022865D3C|nr:hypothetical protein [Pseudomonas sp. BSw22131]
MISLALVTDEASLPIDYDMPLLLDACQAIGFRAEVCIWENPDIDWSRFDAVLLRSPWNCIEQLPEFLAWCERVAADTHLFNPVSVARWGLDKLYLADIAARGVPIIPSQFVEPGVDPALALKAFLAAYPETSEIVVKPTVGSYSRGVQRYTRPREAEAAEHIAQLLGKGCHVILQPYIDSIDRDGETDLIYFDNVYSHAIRKSAMLMPDGTVNVPTLEFRKARTADEEERAVALAALNAAASHLGLEKPLLYGRVDLIRDVHGNPMVMEMEICEPSLNLPFGEGSALRFAQALKERLLG